MRSTRPTFLASLLAPLASLLAFLASLLAFLASLLAFLALFGAGGLLLAGSAAAHVPFVETVIDGDPPIDPWMKAIGDIDRDGLPDLVVAGKDGPVVWYQTPTWAKHVIADTIAGGINSTDIAVADLDGDGDRDVILANGRWYEHPGPLGDPAVDPWAARDYGTDPGHDVLPADLDGDGDLDLVVRDQLANGDHVLVFRQEDPTTFTRAVIPNLPAGEGIASYDLDGDGDIDIVLGDRWLENDGDPVTGAWTQRLFTGVEASKQELVVAVGDVNADGLPDVVVSPAESGTTFDNIYWYEGPTNPLVDPWVRHLILAGVETAQHSLQLADYDNDGDLDVMTGSHSGGPDPDEVYLLLNSGDGSTWTRHGMSLEGTHNAQAADVDGDGDVDVMGANWDTAAALDGGVVKLWLNRSPVDGPLAWTRLSSDAGDLEPPTLAAGSVQSAALIVDVDGDGTDDFVIAEAVGAPSLVWYRRTGVGWTKHVVDDTALPIDGGGAAYDVDGDGDPDIVMGGDASSNRIWWWENPAPNFDPGVPWQRRLVKDGGDPRQHDLAFGDFDGDGADELVYWNQLPAPSRLFLAEIPANPTLAGPWPATLIHTASGPAEGLVAADIDMNGVVDIVAGGYWFEHTAGTSFTPHPIDPLAADGRVAAGQLVVGGRPEVVFSSSESGAAALRWWEWDGSAWQPHRLMDFDVVQGHSLQLADVNGDGLLDVFSAEMADGGPSPKARVFYGDGTGNFVLHEISAGIDLHESRVGDLDGDGDLDVLGKPYDTGTPGIHVWLNDGPAKVLLSLDEWETHLVDPAMPDLGLFIEAADIDGDALPDLVAGAWWYRNPGDLGGAWTRTAIGAPLVNQTVLHDLDGDGDVDVLGTATPLEGDDLYWARNEGDGTFSVFPVGNAGAGAQNFIQGRDLGPFVPGPLQIALHWHGKEGSGNGDPAVQILTLPAGDPAVEPWDLGPLIVSLPEVAHGEGLASADLDDDGDLDLHLGVYWLRNEGDGSWTLIPANPVTGLGDPDRVRVADIDGDGDLDAVVGFHMFDNTTKLIWLEHPADPTTTWPMRTILDQNDGGGFSLDVGDLDNDGDVDVVLGEHLGPGRVLLFENTGDGVTWPVHLVDPGGPTVDHHDGTRLVDLDLDGDLDIVSVGYENHKAWVFENKAVDGILAPDSEPPSVPGNPVATALSSNRVDLRWDPSTDNLFVSNYDVFRDGQPVGNTNQTVFNDVGLSPLTSYGYRVVARDLNGNASAPSAQATAVTLYPETVPPTVPGNLVVVSASAVRIDLTWAPSTDNVIVLGYDVHRDGVLVGTTTMPGYSDFGLAPETAYTYTVTAFDAEGNRSDPLAATVVATTRAREPGLLALWGFDEPSGSTAFDSSGNGHDGTIENSATRTSGFFGGGVEFNGTNGDVDLGTLDIPGAELTISAWIRADDFGVPDARIIGKTTGVATQDHVWMLSTINGPHLRARLRTDDGVTITLTGNAATLPANQWVHAAMTYDGSNLRLYQDGVEVGSVAKTGALVVDPTVEAWIGNNPAATNLVFDGIIDEVKIFTRALSPTAILAEADPDDDDDGILDPYETDTGFFVDAFHTGTSPILADSDGDGVNDGVEIDFGSDPNDPASHPGNLLPALGTPSVAILLAILWLTGTWALRGRARRRA